MIKNKKQMFIVIGVFCLTLLLGTVTYAFFNYTKTGRANSIKTGRIAFNTEQGQAINLTNMFPIDVSGGIPNDATKVGSVTINVTGDTTYAEGLEYLVSAVNVQNTVNDKILPISIDVSYSANGNGKVIGTADNDYFTNRGGNTSIYKILATDTINSNDQLVVGYIKPDNTGIDGNIVIRAYLDKAKIAISDTYPDGDVTHTEGEEPNQTTVTDYTNGTTDTWVGDRTVFTTEEWNSLQANGVSFQIKVESNEGIWVPSPPPTVASCHGCKFMHPRNTYYYGGVNNLNATEVSTLTGVTNDYRTLGESVFIGFTETQDGKLDRAFACGIKEEDPNNGEVYCIEGSMDGSTYTANRNYLNGLFGPYDSVTEIGCWNYDDETGCPGGTGGFAKDSGYVEIGDGVAFCIVYENGNLLCDES